MAGDGVVGQVGTAVGADQGHGFACGHCLVGKRTRGRQAQNIATHHAVEHGTRSVHARRGAPVIHLVVGSNTRHVDGFGRDVGRAAGVGHQLVVGRFGASEAKA